jgi:hypothetical protein
VVLIVDVTGSDFTYHVLVDSEGNPKGFFPQIVDIPDDIRPPLPDGTIEVSETIWHAWMSNPYQRLVNGELVPIDAPLSPHIVITSATKPELNHAFDINSAPYIGDLARDAVSGVGLPGGLPTVGIASMDGTIHDFSGEQVLALYKVLRDTKHQKVIGKATEDTAEIP